jgi:hypothetical protein
MPIDGVKKASDECIDGSMDQLILIRRKEASYADDSNTQAGEEYNQILVRGSKIICTNPCAM